MKKITLFIIISFPNFLFSQQWQQYSDSVISNIKKNDYNRASYFIDLADKNIEKSLVVKDTLYADYIYRKGVVKSYLGDFDSTLLKQSLDIWESSSKKNYLKIMKINYFIGGNYFLLGNKSQNKSEYKESYMYYEKCYSLIKKYNFQKKSNYKGVLNALSLIDYFNEDFKNAKKYANEYINYIKETGIEDYDFNYIQALKINQDFIGQEKILLEYLAKYETQKLNNPELLFKIYFQLFVNKEEQKNGDYPKYPNEVIKYGEKALQIAKENNLKADLELNTIYLQLHITYGQVKDNINEEKYRKLIYEDRSKTNELDYYDELTNLYYPEDYNKFKIKFDEYETLFKNQKKYSDLLAIYAISLNLLERNVLFKKEVVLEQLQLINKNRLILSKDDQIYLDKNLAEYYFFSEEYEISLNICNKYLYVDDSFYKLKFYQFKYGCEFQLGYLYKSYKTVDKTLEIATNIYGENSPRILPFLGSILNSDFLSTNPNSTKISTKALKIIYENKLENTDTATDIWMSLGTKAMNNYNYKDAIIYYERAKDILESTKSIISPILYYCCLIGIANVSMQKNDKLNAKKYIDKVKLFLDNNPNIIKVAYGDYYCTLGDYYFNNDNFIEAKNNYEKAFSIYGDKLSSIKRFRNIICNYLIENNANKTIEDIEKFKTQNNNPSWCSTFIYLLKYNSGNFDSAQKTLFDQLEKLILENNQYFHLLSSYEKNILYKKFLDQFEFLNTYLLENKPDFLKEYINLRFYSKSLLFLNSMPDSTNLEKDRELLDELKTNTAQINKYIEIKTNNIKSIEDLSSRNREIEKFLSENIKPLVVPTLKDLKNKLTNNEAYIEIIRINKQSKNSTKKATDIIKFFTDSISYGAIVIKKNSTPKFILIDGSNQIEKQYASTFKSKIQNKQDDIESYHLLFEKIDNELNDVKKIYLVTDGIYNSINIESIYNPNRKEYLIDYLKIQPIQNVRAITEEKKEFKVGLNTKTVLFGNPDFDLLITDAKTDDFLLDRGLDNDLLDKIKTGLKLPNLAGTEKEIETINSVLKDSKSSVELFSKANATEDNLKNIQSPDILHIATHGYFLKNDDTSKTKQSIANLINENYKDDSYLKSGLLFAGAQNSLNGKQPENTNNGILTAQEAKSLNLKDTELVVLSACETGLGDNLVGEGVIGLQRAFMIAGAKSVIMSLWSVSDEKTQELMTLFYTNWIKNNMSKEEALYQAKIEMKKLYPQPYYWAGFVLLE